MTDQEPVNAPENTPYVWESEIEILEARGWTLDDLAQWKLLHPRERIEGIDEAKH